jgi:hypothetical protein
MSPIWAVPILVVLFGGAGLVALLRISVDSSRELAAEFARFGELHAAVARVRAETRRTTDAVADIRRR